MAWKGDLEGSIEQLKYSETLETNPMTMTFLASAYAMNGQIELCHRKLDELIEYYDTTYTCPYEIATVFVALGDNETAFVYLEKAIHAQSGCIPFMGVDPRMAEIRKMPEYQQIMRGIEHPMIY